MLGLNCPPYAVANLFFAIAGTELYEYELGKPLFSVLSSIYLIWEQVFKSFTYGAICKNSVWHKTVLFKQKAYREAVCQTEPKVLAFLRLEDQMHVVAGCDGGVVAPHTPPHGSRSGRPSLSRLDNAIVCDISLHSSMLFQRSSLFKSVPLLIFLPASHIYPSLLSPNQNNITLY